MRFLSSLPLFFCAALAAQNDFGLVAISPGGGLNGTCTNFTSRGTLGVAAGSILIEVPGSHFSGIGQDINGTGTQFSSVRYLLQDQNAAVAAEIYDFEIRRESPTPPGPDCSPAGVLCGLVGLQSPPGGSPAAFFVTNAFSPPTTCVPSCGTFFMGVNIPANAGWILPAPTWDGLSIHMGSYYQLQGSTASNVAPGAPNIAWDCSAGASAQPTPRTYRFYLSTSAPLLNMCNIDPGLTGTGHCLSLAAPPFTNTDTGPGGLWPQSEVPAGIRHDGLAVRVQHVASAGAPFAVLLGAAGAVCPGQPIPGLITGSLYLSLLGALPIIATGALGANGTALVPTLIVPGPTYFPRNVTLPFQAFVLSSTIHATNMAASRFLP